MPVFRCSALAVLLLFFATGLHADDARWFEIPDGSGEQIRDFADKLHTEFRKRNKEYFEKYRSGKTTNEEDKAYQDFMKRFDATLDDVSDKLLALPDPTAKDKEYAYQRKWSRERRDPYLDSRIRKLEKLVEECEKDPDLGGVQSRIHQDLFRAAVSNAKSLDQVEPLFERLLEYLKKDESGALSCCDPFFQRLKEMDSQGGAKRMNEYYHRLAEALEKSERPETKKILEKLEGAIRFYTLPRRAMELKGVTTDSREIDLADYRGKIVYVDFWAVWCGPCIAEMPDLHDKYRTLKDAGFEVISYSIDTDKDALKTFMEKTKYTWPVISVLASKEKGLKDYYEFYGGGYVPKTVLVGRDGIVIGVDLRSTELDRALKGFFAEELEKKANDPESPLSIRAGFYKDKIWETPHTEMLPDDFLEKVIDFITENKNDRSHHIANLVSVLTSYYQFRLTRPTVPGEEKDATRSANYLRMLDRLLDVLKDMDNLTFTNTGILSRLEALQRFLTRAGKPLEFEAVLHDGRRIDIKDFRGKVVLLCLCAVSSHGPPADHDDPKSSYVPFMLQKIGEFDKKYGDSGLLQIIYPAGDSKVIEEKSLSAHGKWLIASVEKSVKAGLKNYWEEYAMGQSPCWILIDRNGNAVDVKNGLDEAFDRFFPNGDNQ